MELTLRNERWHEVRRLFDVLVELDPGQREQYLHEACGDDVWLCREVRSLLDAFDAAGDFLGLRGRDDAPAAGPVPSPALPDLPEVGSGQYRVVRELGRGGMGEVYLAEDLRLDRLVALKLLLPHLSADAEAKARLTQEARTAAVLDHANVATVYEIGEARDGRLFVAMAYCEGETLRERLRAGALPVDEAIRLAGQLAAGLAAAHRKGIVHRDVKPSNVIVTPEGPLKIVDFGLAKRTGQDLTRSGVTLGTIAYMSPEQIQAEAVDHRTDLWSLGVVLYEMLAGRSPFCREHEVATIYAILHTDPPPLSELRSDVPEPLSAVVAKALAKEREHRYACAEALIDDLAHLHTTADRPEPPAARAPWLVSLPASPTALIGRREELEAVRRLVRDGARLVTLTGPGGTGKTRLGLAAAAALAPAFPDGVCFVPLAPLAAAALVETATARALGVHDAGGVPVREGLIERLKVARMLLVLDNFEHVVEAAEFVSTLLAACPALTVLVTSRTPLRVQGEHEFPVPPLGLPRPADFTRADRLSTSEAVALFAARARAVRPAFTLTDENGPAVAEICVRLDGLPLAIELAAARIKVLPPRALLARLERRFDLLADGARDRPARHRALRETIAWSYDLLGPADQRLFRRLSVFAGGLTLEATEAVCRDPEDLDPDDSAFDVLGGLSALVNQSLLCQEEQPDGEPRFFMLETIREFALDVLRACSEEDRTRRAHLDFFAGYVETAAPELRGPDQVRWCNQLELEHHNIRAAIGFAMETDPVAAARIMAAFWLFYTRRSFISEGYEWVVQVLTRTGPALTAVLRARLLAGASMMAMYAGLITSAVSMLEEARSLLRGSGEDALMAEVMNHLCWMLMLYGDNASALQLADETIALSRHLGNDRSLGTAHNNLGFLYLKVGRYTEAAVHFEQSIAAYRRFGDLRGLTRSQTNLGLVRHFQGRLQEAESLHRASLVANEATGDVYALATSRQRLALSRHEQGEAPEVVAAWVQEAIALFHEAGHQMVLMEAEGILAHLYADSPDLHELERLYRTLLDRARQSGVWWFTAQALRGLGDVCRQRGDTDEAIRYYHESLRLRARVEDGPGVAESLEALCRAAADRAQPARAARLLGAAQAIRTAAGAPFLPRDGARLTAVTDRLREALGTEAFAQALAAGNAMSYDEAVRFGLEEA